MFNLLTEKQTEEKSEKPISLPFSPKFKNENKYAKLNPSSKTNFKQVTKSGGGRKNKLNFKANASPRQAQRDIKSYFFRGGANSSRVEPENETYPHSSLNPAFTQPHNCKQAAQSKNNTRGGLVDQYQPVQMVNTQKTSTESNKDAINKKSHVL